MTPNLHLNLFKNRELLRRFLWQWALVDVEPRTSVCTEVMASFVLYNIVDSFTMTVVKIGKLYLPRSKAHNSIIWCVVSIKKGNKDYSIQWTFTQIIILLLIQTAKKLPRYKVKSWWPNMSCVQWAPCYKNK